MYTSRVRRFMCLHCTRGRTRAITFGCHIVTWPMAFIRPRRPAHRVCGRGAGSRTNGIVKSADQPIYEHGQILIFPRRAANRDRGVGRFAGRRLACKCSPAVLFLFFFSSTAIILTRAPSHAHAHVREHVYTYARTQAHKHTFVHTFK